MKNLMIHHVTETPNQTFLWLTDATKCLVRQNGSPCLGLR